MQRGVGNNDNSTGMLTRSLFNTHNTGRHVCHLRLGNLNSLFLKIFDTTNYGRKVSISVKGAGLTMFTNSVFQCPPDAITLIDAPNVKFINCYTRADGQPIGI